MAKTYTVGEALTIVGSTLSRQFEDTRAAYIANIAQAAIWDKYDWRETIALLPPFYLVPNEQDYGPPAITVPTDFSGLRQTYLVNPNGSPADRKELHVRRNLRLTGAEALPEIIGYDEASSKFRVFPRTPAGIGATDWMVDGTYKTLPAKLTPSTFQTTPLTWDDKYFRVYLAALKWAAFDLLGDQRAGGIMEQSGQFRATGQYGLMHQLIDEMASAEGLNLGDPSIAPAESLLGNLDYGFFAPGLVGF